MGSCMARRGLRSCGNSAAPAHRAPLRQGDTLAQLLNASPAHAVDLSVWHEVHGFGILKSSVIFGVMNAKVWLRTLTAGQLRKGNRYTEVIKARRLGVMSRAWRRPA